MPSKKKKRFSELIGVKQNLLIILLLVIENSSKIPKSSSLPQLAIGSSVGFILTKNIGCQITTQDIIYFSRNQADRER